MTCVLLVEDDEPLSDALSYLLRKHGSQAAVCPADPDALEMSGRAVLHRRRDTGSLPRAAVGVAPSPFSGTSRG
jgi:DNA-binding response OmpR family regulator